MLTSILKVLVNNLFLKSFNITFMKNEKNCQDINYFFPFPIKTFFNWIISECPKNTP